MKGINKIFLFLLFSCLFFVFIAGCATISVREPGEVFDIRGVKYYTLSELCRLNRIDWTWDYLGEVAILREGRHEIKIMPESSLALLNKKIVDLQNPVILKDSKIFVPVAFKTEIIDKIFYDGLGAKNKLQAYLISKKVVIDAGHGGKDPGAISKAGIFEKDIVLDIAHRLEDKFNEKGIQVVMTRERDVFIPLTSRAEIANKSKADLFISIHANSNPLRHLSGIEAYFLTNNVNDYLLAEEAAKVNDVYFNGNTIKVKPVKLKAILWDMLYTDNRREAVRLAGIISRELSRATGLKSQGIKSANFSVLRSSLMPSVLIEAGYLSNANDEKKLKDASFRQKIAEGISNAIIDFFESESPLYY